MLLSKSSDQVNMSSGGETEAEESALLNGLAAEVRDQSELEKDIGRQVRGFNLGSAVVTNSLQADQLLALQANERDQKRLDKTQAERRWVFLE